MKIMKIQKVRWFNYSLPLFGMAAIVVLSFRFGMNKIEQNHLYRYNFPIPASGTVTQELTKEITFLQGRIKLAPTDGLDRTHLAKIYLKMARATGNIQWYLLAEQLAKRSLANLPFNNSGAVIVLARIAEAKHDFPQAVILANKVLQEQPNHEDALSLLVSSNLAMGKLTTAAKLADTLANQVPALNTLSLRALVKAAQGRDQEALADFKQAIAMEDAGETGSSAKVRTQMGKFYFQRGNLTVAKQLYEEVLRILPRYPLALVYLAELETREGNYAAAEQHYAEVFVSAAYSNTFDHLAWFGRAQLKDLQGDRATATEYWQKASGLLDQHSNLSEFGHRREAAKLLLMKAKSADLPKALSLMEAEVKIRRDAETLEIYAWVLTRLERWQEAQQILQEALSLGTRNATVFYRAGKVEAALGNQERAIAFFQKAQATDSSFNLQAKQLVGLL